MASGFDTHMLCCAKVISKNQTHAGLHVPGFTVDSLEFIKLVYKYCYDLLSPFYGSYNFWPIEDISTQNLLLSVLNYTGLA